MWGPSGPDPGSAHSPEKSSDLELDELKDQFEQQQLLITQLKEMLKKSDQSVVAQKMEEYANTLNRISARAKQGKQQRGEDEAKPQTSTLKTTPAKEKILLLKQQMEENKVKIAQRGKFHKNIEETFSQLKVHLDDSQQQIKPLNVTVAEPKPEMYSINSTAEELFNILVAKEKIIADLKAKNERLETQNVDLQDTLKEKDSVIDAKTKAITLMTENLSRKGKHTLDTLDDTKEQMRHMQENFVRIEEEMKSDKRRLLAEVQRLQETCTVLEKARDDLRNENFKQMEKIDSLNKTIDESQVNKEKDLEPSKFASPSASPRSSFKNKRGRRGTKGAKDANLESSQITALEKSLEEAKNENENLLKQIYELENIIRDSKTEIEELKCKVDTDETVNLKKQIDDNNKNMIKIKAQHKSKLKELTKQIDEFKKINDTNAEIVRLNAENARMKEKIDAGNEQITALKHELESRETEMKKLQLQLENNTEVASQIMSIQYEEQLDQLEMEKRDLVAEKNSIVEKITGLQQVIAMLNKDKQELNAKLESYMNENMELLDKLEKLSAEKVSSAESIEIVESFTQQEKMELEAYQKSLEYAPESVENIDKHTDPNPELNESVNQLTEETSDLLRKIELFTEERREVMDKLDHLTAENSTLHTKIKEIENNRELLVETYEQLQNEKETIDKELSEMAKQKTELLNKIAEIEAENAALKNKLQNDGDLPAQTQDDLQRQKERIHDEEELQETINVYKHLLEIKDVEIKDLKIELLSQQDLPKANREAHEKLDRLESQYEQLREENETLRKKLREIAASAEEKDELAAELSVERKRANEFEGKWKTVTKESEDYKGRLEENEKEIIQLKSVINDLNANLAQSEMESKKNVEKNEEMAQQLKQLKDMINENVQEVNVYKTEIDNKEEIIANLNKTLQENCSSIEDIKDELEMRTDELESVIKERDSNKSRIESLQNEIKEKDQMFHVEMGNLREKCLVMHNQIQQNSGSLDHIQTPLMEKIAQLEQDNREQLNKMKKIAANLKKKTLALQEVEQQRNDEREKWENEDREKDDRLSQLSEQAAIVQNDLREKIDQINQLKMANDELVNQKQNYEVQLHAYAREAEISRSTESNTLNMEINEKNQIIADLNQQLEEVRYNLTTATDAHSVKVRELEMFIESKEADIVKYKEQVNRLEDGLATVEERRLSLEKKAVELGAELAEKHLSFEEMSQSEDLLEQRLAALVAHDERIEKQLHNAISENRTLHENVQLLTSENAELKHKLSSATEQMLSNSGNLEKLQSVEMDNVQLSEQIKLLENNYKQLQDDCDRKMKNKNADIANIDAMLQEQVELLDSERKTLSTRIQQLEEEVSGLSNEIATYRDRIDQQQSDFERQIIEVDRLEEVNRRNLSVIDQLTAKAEPAIEHLEKQSTAEANVAVFRGFAEDTIDPQNAFAAISNDGNEELLNKVKTLEFMLFSVEKEKDELHAHCQELTNEIARMLYQKQLPSDVDAQICSPEAIKMSKEDRATLHQLEYAKTKDCPSTSKTPVVEEMIQPAKAYQCYEQDQDENRVQEVNVEAFDENDDGWGWSPDEAKLEEDHCQQMEAANPLHSSRQQHVEQLEMKVHALEGERDQHLREIQTYQVKSTKLIRKLKEFKAENERLKRADLGGLDDAIQEELKSQISKLEQRIREASNEREKEKNERATLMHKYENLQAVNESMQRAKENYEIELIAWQQQNRELSDRLNRFEWGNESESPQHAHSAQLTSTAHAGSEQFAQKIDELHETIKELSLDNEELQIMLEQQRQLRLALEKSKCETNSADDDTYQSLLAEKQTINAQLEAMVADKHQLQAEFDSLLQTNVELNQALERAREEKGHLQNLIGQNNYTIDELQMELQSLRANNINEDDIVAQVAYLKAENEQRLDEIAQLREIEQQLVAHNAELNQMKTILTSEKVQLVDSLRKKNDEIELMTNRLSLIERETLEIANYREQNQRLSQEVNELKQQAIVRDQEYAEKMSLTVEEITHEWLHKVDQRGFEVAESWKLHLSERENEFTQLEQTLRAQIGSLEERCQKLINENGELRRNVDNEIRNEVDQISALQGTIDEKDRCIGELNLRLQSNDEMIALLNTRISDAESTISGKSKEIEELQLQLAAMHEQIAANFVTQLQNNQTIIGNLQAQGERLQATLAEKLTTISDLEGEIQRRNADVVTLTHNLEALTKENQARDHIQQQVDQYLSEISNLKLENEKLQQHLHDYEESLIQAEHRKESELNKLEIVVQQLKDQLEEKDQEQRKQLDLITAENENVFREKAHEVDALQLQLTQQQAAHQNLLVEKQSEIDALRVELENYCAQRTVTDQFEHELEAKTAECTRMQTLFDANQTQNDEDRREIDELKHLIEKHVLKIESLKNEYRTKCDECDSLMREMEKREKEERETIKELKRIESHEDLTTPKWIKQDSVAEDEVLEPVSRAELDLALYMLHQRDMRCEELTVELVELLHERDTLQLKLSNTIREKEELKRTFAVPEQSAESTDKESASNAPGPSAANVEVHDKEQRDRLKSKLSELKSMGYGKDKTLLDEKQQRRYQELSLMQQHRDVASLLPPEAAAKLVQDANYTLSRDVQSPSKVLLNWLWGKSTPKVNNI